MAARDRERREFVVEPERRLEVSHRADAVVCGGGTAGVAAAVCAGRLGLSVVMVERAAAPGGMLTHVISGVQDRRGKGGFVREFMSALQERGFSETRLPGREHLYNRGYLPFYLDELLADAGVRPLYLALAVAPLMEENRLTGVVVESKSGRTAVRAPIVIDATGDGDIAVRAGAACRVGRDGDGACQSMSAYSFLLEYDGTVIADKPAYRAILEEAERKAGGGFELTYKHERLAPVPRTGTTANLGAHVYGYDATDADGLSRALVELRRQMWQSFNFLKENVSFFRDAKLGPMSALPGVRESRRIDCDVPVTLEDALAGRRSEEGLFTVRQMIDIHRRDPGDPDIILRHVSPYHVPYGALLPRGLENIIVAGRCIGGDHESLASYRIASECMAMGEAAAVAASLALGRGCTPRGVPGREVAAGMKARGYEL